MGSSSTRVTGYVCGLKVSPPIYFFINYSGENSNFLLADTTLTKWPKLINNTTSNKTNWHLHIWYTENTSILQYSCQKLIYHERVSNNLNLIMKKYQTDLEGHSINDLYSTNMSKSRDQDRKQFQIK